MRIDFKERTVNRKPFTCAEPTAASLEECLEKIEELYHTYKYSTPTENDERRTYFYALTPDEMTDAELALGANRYEAKEELELYVLKSIVSGVLTWDDKVMGGTWFYQGKDKDLIILKDWVA